MSTFKDCVYFLFKGSLNIPDYRYLLIGRVQYLYTKEHAVEYRNLQVLIDLYNSLISEWYRCELEIEMVSHWKLSSP